ncbi:hypothetical protein TSTA_017410 [Talaromyces stipitatus ATCC 10500]|uniref:Uncharacterized protein n=1 Tax=Talaromyces stipitatus (strain ATCC 10500 / CBS 375.48 / QM 6759 / NRRL 1006) TaxID=441959 RepID=B8MFD2_TALSN|nr:uncharacterized protein TSTA_017410 [Talaromyces stipitatus ATCC 10500]EED16666.1 hypothetical protein TSTA_017410 [Talaromyces stipitatus ATCC 10500]
MATIKASDDSGGAITEKQGQFAFLPERTCAICYHDQNPTSTSEADILEKLEAEEGEGWTCLRCGEIVKQCKPWNGDVLEEAPRSSSNGKVVGFVVAEDKEEREKHISEDETTIDNDELEEDKLSDMVANDTFESSRTWSTIDRETLGDVPESG